MVEIKTPGEVDAIRAAGRVVAQALAATRKYAAARVRLTELDEVARSVLASAGATSPFLGYLPRFAPRSDCFEFIVRSEWVLQNFGGSTKC